MGRPKIPDELKRSQRISVSYTQTEFDRINREFNISAINDLARYVALSSLGAEISAQASVPEINKMYLSELRLLREAVENLECQIEEFGADHEALGDIKKLATATRRMATSVANPHIYREIS